MNNAMFEQKKALFEKEMHVGLNFDAVERVFLFGKERPAALFYLAGLCSGEQIQKLLESLMTAPTPAAPSDLSPAPARAEKYAGKSAVKGAEKDAVKDVEKNAVKSAEMDEGKDAGKGAEAPEDACDRAGITAEEARRFLLRAVPCGEVSDLQSEKQALAAVYAGSALLIVSGISRCFLIDLKKYPARSIEEPMKDKVLRGSRDGFTESLLPNAALIRRRIRDERLIFRRFSVGSRTATDLLICYLEGEADGAFVETIVGQIADIDVQGLNMGQESLAELLVKKKWYNPFPKVRYTERPDAAAAMLSEGSVILLCDNYPAAMILPTSFFDFLQDTDDFYFTPTIGGYLKTVRNAVFAASLLLTPVWYALQTAPELLPPRLSFLLYNGSSFLPLLFQLLLVELCIDGLKLASLNTPDTLSNSLGVISALILGDLAVDVGWLSEQVILYMAFVAIANFTQPSYEMGYAFKFMRIVTLALIAFFSFRGLVLGALLTVVLICTNNSVFSGKGYLYPLLPFNKRALLRLLFRVRLKRGGGGSAVRRRGK